MPLIQDLIDIIQKDDQTPAHINSSVLLDVVEEYSDWKNIAFFED